MDYKIKVASVDTLLITFCNSITIECSQKVQKAYTLFKSELDAKEIIPSYSSIAISFDIVQYSFEEIEQKVKKLLEKMPHIKLTQTDTIIEIPAFYDSSIAPDLQRLANIHKLSLQELITIHSKQLYYVYTIGFLPGFAYMGDVDKKIATPRLKTPRANVPKGSIAIANKQCAIYPQNSPGGWNIIAKTPLELTSKEYPNFSLLQIGNRVKFIPINKMEFLKLGGSL